MSSDPGFSGELDSDLMVSDKNDIFPTPNGDNLWFIYLYVYHTLYMYIHLYIF